MKKIFFVIAAAAMMLVGCTKELEQRIDSLDQRVSALEEAVKALNSDVDAIQTVLDALKQNVYVSAVNQLTDGYEIVFTNGTKATIKNGANGKDGVDGKDGATPVIGVATVDGVLVWTVNGQPLKDAQGNSVPAAGKDGANGADGKDGQNGTDGKDGQNGADGKDGVTPEFKLENGKLYYTVGGEWIELGNVTGEDGQDANAWFTLSQDANTVTLTLTDGSGTIVLPKYNAFDITFESLEIPVLVNGTLVEIPYTITGNDPAVVQVLKSLNCSIQNSTNPTYNTGVFPAKDGKSGVIKVVVNAFDAYLHVYAINNKTGEIKAKALTFTKGTMKVSEELEVEAVGAEFQVAVTTDQTYEVDVDELPSWLKYVETKAVRTDKLTFKAEKNTTANVRTAVIYLNSVSRYTDRESSVYTLATVKVTQKPLATAFTVTPETLDLLIGSEEKFTVSVTPAAADQNVVWTLPAGGELVMDGNFVKVNPEAIEKGYANTIAGKTYKVKAASVSNPEFVEEIEVKVKAVMVEAIDIPAPKEYIAAKVGQIIPLEWTVLPAEASDKAVTFASSNEKVVKVDDKGVVTVVGPGEAKVVITSNDQFCTLAADPTAYVAPSADVVFAVTNEIAASTIAFAADAVNLPVKGEVDVTPVVGPETAKNVTVDYQILGEDGKTSSDLVVVNGKVKLNPAFVQNYQLAGKVGKTYTVVASLVDNPTVKDEVKVTVTAVLVESLVAEAFETKMGLAEYKAAPVVTVNPANADDKTLYWTVKEGKDVVSVDASTGVVTPKKAGYATLVATATDDFNTNYEKPRVEVEVPVTVLYEDGEAPVNTLKFDAESYNFVISKDAKFDLASKLVLDPALEGVKLVWACTLPSHMKTGYGSTAEYAYSLDQTGSLNVNSKYWITDNIQTAYPGLNMFFSPWYDNAIKVSVYSENNPDVKAETVVKIAPVAVEKATFGVEQLDMFVGKKVQIKPEILPENATVKAPYSGYKSSNPSVVTVDQDGNLEAKAEGEATITYSAANPFGQNMEVKASVKVVVKLNAPKAIKVQKPAVDVVLNETVDLAAVAGVAVDPSDPATTSQELVWSIVNRYGKQSAFATVTEDGKVTITDFNTYGVNNPDNVYTVTVASAVDASVKAEIAVTVGVVMPKAIEWGAEVTTMKVGEEFPQIIKYISAKEGYEVTYQEVRYESSNPAAVKIENGRIVAVAAAEDVTLTCYYNGKYAPVDEAGNPVYNVAPISMTFDVVK